MTVGFVVFRPGGVQGDPDAVEAGLDDFFQFVRQSAVGVEVYRALGSFLSDHPDAFRDDVGNCQRFAFAALAEAGHRFLRRSEMVEDELRDLLRRRREGDAVLRGTDVVARLEGDAAKAVAVAGPACWQRHFPAAQGVVPGGGAAVGETAVVHQMLGQPIILVNFLYPGRALQNLLLVEGSAVLALVLVDPDGRHHELVVDPADGGVTVER